YFATARVFNPQPRYACVDAQPHVFRYCAWIVGITILVVRVNWNVGCFDNFSDMLEHHIASDSAVGQSAREREPSRRCRDRFEAKMLQVTRGADIPRIWNRKAAAPVQFAKSLSSLGDCRHDCYLNSRTGFR